MLPVVSFVQSWVFFIESSVVVIGTSMQVFSDTTTIWQEENI